jgi:serine/threonine protein kinase
MGEVYAAQDTELGRTVALKFLRADLADKNRIAEGGIREAKTASALNHPNIVTVHEVIHGESTLVIVMELVEGTNLRVLCGKRPPVDQMINLGQQIASALAAAHIHGIVHRDVKPENIMVRRDGYVKVLDFGLARQVSADSQNSVAGLPAGTLRYMSPEQVRGATLTGASDVFSLGLVLYELLTGKHPFAADSALETAHAIATGKPRRPSAWNRFIPPMLDVTLLSMLAKDPGARPPAEHVARTLAEMPRTAVDRRRASLGLRTTASTGKRTWPILAGAALLVAGVLLWYEKGRILPQKALAFHQRLFPKSWRLDRGYSLGPQKI